MYFSFLYKVYTGYSPNVQKKLQHEIKEYLPSKVPVTYEVLVETECVDMVVTKTPKIISSY